MSIYTQPKKCYHPKILFFHLIISLSFLEFQWKILYRWKADILNFFIVQKFFLYFEDFLSFEFLNKNRVFFYYIKKYYFANWNQKNFFLWKLPVALIILQKKFYQKLPSLIRFWHSELYTEFQLLKILHFSFKILTKLRKFTCLQNHTHIQTIIWSSMHTLFSKNFLAK